MHRQVFLRNNQSQIPLPAHSVVSRGMGGGDLLCGSVGRQQTVWEQMIVLERTAEAVA